MDSRTCDVNWNPGETRPDRSESNSSLQLGWSNFQSYISEDVSRHCLYWTRGSRRSFLQRLRGRPRAKSAEKLPCHFGEFAMLGQLGLDKRELRSLPCLLVHRRRRLILRFLCG